jgi:hypothetical protein
MKKVEAQFLLLCHLEQNKITSKPSRRPLRIPADFKMARCWEIVVLRNFQTVLHSHNIPFSEIQRVFK